MRCCFFNNGYKYKFKLIIKPFNAFNLFVYNEKTLILPTLFMVEFMQNIEKIKYTYAYSRIHSNEARKIS